LAEKSTKTIGSVLARKGNFLTEKAESMEWLHYISYFFGGAFLSNAIPHFVSGVMGRPFQSPFAKPPGQGLSSSTVNVLWGVFNFAVSYILICRVGEFGLRSTTHVALLGLGFLLTGLVGARQFGRFHGGNSPQDPSAGSGL
jgi:hypothetical protein